MGVGESIGALPAVGDGDGDGDSYLFYAACVEVRPRRGVFDIRPR